MRRIFAGLLMLSAASVAQEFRATISGRVSDSQNAVIGGAKIIATQIGTEAKFETVGSPSQRWTDSRLSRRSQGRNAKANATSPAPARRRGIRCTRAVCPQSWGDCSAEALRAWLKSLRET